MVVSTQRALIICLEPDTLKKKKKNLEDMMDLQTPSADARRRCTVLMAQLSTQAEDSVCKNCSLYLHSQGGHLGLRNSGSVLEIEFRLQILKQTAP